MLVVLVATFWLVAYSWLPFTPSVLVLLSVPAATLVTFLLPAFTPVVVTLGPPVIVSPLLFRVVVPPIIAEVKTGFSAICTSRLPFASTTVFRFLSE